MGRIKPLSIENQQPRPAARALQAFSAGLLIVALTFAGSAPAAARPTPESFADLTAEVAPALVLVAVVQTGPESDRIETPRGEPPLLNQDHPFHDFFEPFFDNQPGHLLWEYTGGSGFIIDAEGYIVTNYHVIADADGIFVILQDGRSFPAALVGQDETTDLALLMIESEATLPTIAFGDSDAVRPGDWVIAFGNPFGLGRSVTAGIVSARKRDLPGGSNFDLLQLDAHISKGNSGGPTIDMNGHVIGVTTAIFSPNGGNAGIGFAIPSNLARDVVAELRAHGNVSRSWLGVRLMNLWPETAYDLRLDGTEGALVSSVTPDSAAAQAGLESGDIILSWDGQNVTRMWDLTRLIFFTPAGLTVPVEIWRDGARRSLTVITRDRP